MKKLPLILIGLITVAAFEALAQSPPSFTVTGYGRVFYEPDSYDLSFGVTTDNPNLQKCKEQHIAVLSAVKGFLYKKKDKIISFKQDATRLETVSRNDRKERFFQFSTIYVARTKDVQSLLPVQEALISAGVTDILGLDLFSERLPELIEQARKEAINDAKRKAELAASELGWTLTGASTISFKEPDWWGDRRSSVQYGSRAYTYDREKRPELTTYVSSQVSIEFSFEKKK